MVPLCSELAIHGSITLVNSTQPITFVSIHREYGSIQLPTRILVEFELYSM